MPKGAKRKAAAAAASAQSGAMEVDDAPVTAAPAQALKKKQGGKRKKGGDEESSSDEGEESGDEKEGEDTEMLDVSFSFFDPQPQDYHSFKHLFSQLLQGDAAELDLGGVADLVLEQKLVGSTVKTDNGEGDETAQAGDPYAVLTVLNLNVHKTNPALASLLAYLLLKLTPSHPFFTLVSSLVENPADSSSSTERKHIGLVLSERLVNMPVQVVPPMYKMLGEELEWAREDGEPYHFHSLLFLSRVFASSSEDFSSDPNAALEAASASAVGAGGWGKKAQKKAKKAKVEGEQEKKWWNYHAEDEFIAKFATHTHVFPYTNAKRQEGGGADEFGVDSRAQLMLVPWEKFGEIVEGMEGFVAATA